MKKLLANLVILVLLSVSVQAQPEEKATCKVESYDSRTGVLVCKSGRVYQPHPSARKNRKLSKDTDVLITYVQGYMGKSNYRMWLRIAVEVEIKPRK